jgi:hypothetical protein
VLTYVRAVLSGEKKGDPAVGRYLMDTLGASTDDLEKGGFNTSLQVRGYFMLPTRKWTNECVLSSGYFDDFLPCQPCPRSSRSFLSIGPYSCIIEDYNIWLSDLFLFALSFAIRTFSVRYVSITI